MKVYKAIRKGIGFCLISYCSLGLAVNENPSWFLGMGLGYNDYKDTYRYDGQFASLRFVVGKELITYKKNRLGFEFGGETGNTMRYNLPVEITERLGGLPFQFQLKSFLDLLAFNKVQYKDSRVFGVLKGGIAFRSLQFERCSADDVRKISPEFQIGLEYQHNPRYSFHLLYRVIVGKRLIYDFNPSSNHLNISGIPTQYGVLLGASLFLDNLG